MFKRLQKVLGNWHKGNEKADPLRDWAQRQQLALVPVTDAYFVLSGELHGSAFRAECGPPSRDFVQGMELRAKTELGFRQPGAVVVMNRSLKRQLDAEASALYSDYIDDLQTSALQLPEEIRWLSLYRDMGWSGPPDSFWAEFAVLTDSPDLARQWLNPGLIRALQETAGLRHADGSPFMMMLMRGNAYLRVQIDTEDDRHTQCALLAFFEGASQAAKASQPG